MKEKDYGTLSALTRNNVELQYKPFMGGVFVFNLTEPLDTFLRPPHAGQCFLWCVYGGWAMGAL